MSCGLTLASTVRLSASGTISMIGVAGGDDAADGVHGGLKHRAVLRRANFDALELIFRSHLALDEFADLAVDLARLLGDLAAEIAVDLDDLQFGLGDLASDLGGLRDQLRRSRLPAAPRRAPARSARSMRHELLFPKIVDADHFALDQLDFLCPWIPAGRCSRGLLP